MVLAIHDGVCGGLASTGEGSSDGFAIVPLPPDMKNAEPEASEPAQKKERAKKKDFCSFLISPFAGWVILINIIKKYGRMGAGWGANQEKRDT